MGQPVEAGTRSACPWSAIFRLPASQIQTQNVVANESKGLSKSQPIEKENEPDAIPIPDKSTKVKPKPVTSASKAKPQPQAEEPSNEVPFGQGGPVSGPYGTFSANGAKGGFGVQGGGGDFGSHYAYYVQGIQRRITENWLRYEIDPNDPAGQSGLCHVRHQSVRPAIECANRAIQRSSLSGQLGAADRSTRRFVWVSACRIFRQQGVGRVLVRLQALKRHIEQ